MRIVRVLTGYSRIYRCIENMVPVNIGNPDLTWLPAVEYYGEGFFIEINIDKIKEFAAIIDALENSVNCSYDPVCYESPGQGIDGLNLAACYACALVPETSCTYRNQFLDRTLLIDRENGFFNEIIEGAS